VFGKILSRRGNRGHTGALQDLYRCAGDDNWVAISVLTKDQRATLADLIGGPDTPVAEWFATQDLESAVERLAGAGIPVAAVVSPSLVTENPQLRHRGFFECLDHPSTGEGMYPCPPFARLNGTDKWLFRPPPTLGRHNAEVLSELCGLTDDELVRLAAQGVIGTRPKGAVTTEASG
jgi:crotonobetainyl-CoA:carnitine CoA-transferase CaiB-like acyl-CoA transferase